MTLHSSIGKLLTTSWILLHGTASSVPSDPQAYGSWVLWVSASAAVAGAPGQQAQDAVTMASAMWRMISSDFQQQQCQVCLAFAPGTPQIRGTPVRNPSYPGFMATPLRFPALAPVQVQQVDCTLTPTTVAQLVMTSNAGRQDNGSHSSWQHGGVAFSTQR